MNKIVATCLGDNKWPGLVCQSLIYKVFFSVLMPM